MLRRRRARRTCWRRASTGCISTRPGTATPASTRCIATATRCGATRPTIRRTGRPCSPPTRPTSCSRRSPRPRTSTSATAAAPSTTAASTRPTASQASTSPLYALIASNEVAAAMMDGPAGQTLTQEVIDEAVACRLAVARVRQEFMAKKDWFFAPWNAGEGPEPEDRQAIPFHEAPAELLATDPSCWVLHAGRKLARVRGHPRQLVHARPDQVRHRLPRACRTTASSAANGHPGRHRHRVPGPPRDRAVAHHRPHGALPLLGRASPRASGARCSTRCSTSRSITTATRRSPKSCRGVVAGAPRALRRHGAQGPGRRDVGRHEGSRQGHWQAQAYATLPTPEMTPRRAFQRFMAGERREGAARQDGEPRGRAWASFPTRPASRS